MSDIAASAPGIAGPGKHPVAYLLPVRFALRELRGGLAGFYVLIACIALGVAAIAGVNSVSKGMTRSIQSEGQLILGGDLEFSRIHTKASVEERAFLESLAAVSEIGATRAIVRFTTPVQTGTSPANGQMIVDLKAVDDTYPLYGSFDIVGGGNLQDLLAPVDGEHGIVVAHEITAQSGLDVGDRLELGRGTFRIRGLTETEPDNLAMGIAIGPRVIVSMEGLEHSDLVKPGSLVRWHYRLRIDPDGTVPDRELRQVADSVQEAFPTAGWRLRDRTNAAPGLSSSIERFSQFLTLVGLTALIAGGVGVANAVAAFVDSKREVIATFKCLGAPGSFVVQVYLIQILAMSGIGILLGVMLGAMAPLVAATFLAHLLPVGSMRGLFPAELGLSMVYGLLTALVFALWPLGRAHDIHPTALFRDKTAAPRTWPRFQYVLATGLVVLILAVLAIGLAEDRQLAAIYLAAVLSMLILLRFVASGISWLARRAPRVSITELRLAIGNIHRPGALTPSVVLSLGLGLAVLVALTLIDVNMRGQLTGNIPNRAPSFFFLDIQDTEVEDFRALIANEAPEARLDEAPMLRGRIVSLGGIANEDLDQDNEEAWVLRGDRGITFRSGPPTNSKLVSGEWWPADTTEKLVSMDHDLVEAFGLEIGDEVTVNVLGREVTATLANTRVIEWQSLSINFVLIFSPATFAGAPYPSLVTATYPDMIDGVALADPDLVERELNLLAKITRAFPTVTSVRVKEALDAVNRFVADLALAVRAAVAVTLVASVFVLAGALAAGQRQRIHDAIILKTLGATRGRIIGAFVLEYMILGIATAMFGLIAGSLSAFFVLEYVMQISFAMHVRVIVATVLAALALTLGFGLIGTWRALGQKPASILRNL